MVTVTVSSKYQVVIPVAIREELNLHVGQKIQLIPYQDRIEFVPLQDIREMRGFLKGIDTDVPRDGDRV
ncbi:MAG: AbrB/MazE/SpoVT family DNA-binding domain-containing protein [Gemmatimonadetes bacterium]|jgi:AbrB family looped-hinge helix DNA binding protein|nr:AbrB/MazE/SpoVT family DNA-binding domain-containing protein [Gemmatimonadota bacterium]MBT7914956.1 AbrB/MazE/SpoVT family DNA-binding domain-containing protein [Candidatus Bathyarchaeota archaeon]